MILVGIIWFVLAIVIGVAADRRGRSGFGWFLLAVLLSPLVAGILLAVLPDLYMRSLLEEPRRSSAVDDRALEQLDEAVAGVDHAADRGQRGKAAGVLAQD